jgi:hypothetical protein
MTKSKKDFYAKTLLMLGLAGAVLSVAHAGFDADEAPPTGSQSMNETAEMRAAHTELLLATLSEEFTEISSLAAQQARFRQFGDHESTQIARMYGRWINDHKAGVFALAQLIRNHGGDPEAATEKKAPVLGTKEEMLMATHAAHEAAVRTSQQRFGATNDWDIRWAMHNRANTARKHLAEMRAFHGG